jgi:hypothetical protein
MAKKSKFTENDAVDGVEGDEAEVVQSEAGRKISEAQRGVPKNRVHVQVNGGEVFGSLCAALIATNLDKVKDWPAARNALKKEGTYTRMAPASEVIEGEPAPEEIEVTFTLVDAPAKVEEAPAEAEAA